MEGSYIMYLSSSSQAVFSSQDGSYLLARGRISEHRPVAAACRRCTVTHVHAHTHGTLESIRSHCDLSSGGFSPTSGHRAAEPRSHRRTGPCNPGITAAVRGTLRRTAAGILLQHKPCGGFHACLFKPRKCHDATRGRRRTGDSPEQQAAAGGWRRRSRRRWRRVVLLGSVAVSSLLWSRVPQVRVPLRATSWCACVTAVKPISGMRNASGGWIFKIRR